MAGLRTVQVLDDPVCAWTKKQKAQRHEDGSCSWLSPVFPEDPDAPAANIGNK